MIIGQFFNLKINIDRHLSIYLILSVVFKFTILSIRNYIGHIPVQDSNPNNKTFLSVLLYAPNYVMNLVALRHYEVFAGHWIYNQPLI